MGNSSDECIFKIYGNLKMFLVRGQSESTEKSCRLIQVVVIIWPHIYMYLTMYLE